MTNIVSITNGRTTTTSLLIAQHFNKQHGHVMRSIQNLECSEEFGQSNFGLTDYADTQGKKRPCYNITRDGFVFLAMGFTGKHAAEWKEKYIKAFNEMEEYIRQQKAEEERQKQLPFDNITGKRYLAYFNLDRQLSLKEINDDAFIISEEEIAKVLREPGAMIKTKTIIDIMSACAEVMSRRSKALA